MKVLSNDAIICMYIRIVVFIFLKSRLFCSVTLCNPVEVRHMLELLPDFTALSLR
jgi:hypothetical protein